MSMSSKNNNKRMYNDVNNAELLKNLYETENDGRNNNGD